MATAFDFGAGPVPAHKHKNGGGWVADTAEVADHVYVGGEARIAGGTFNGGAFYGGTFNGGTFRDGEFYDSTDHISGFAGSFAYTAYRVDKALMLQYGCEYMPVAEWTKNLKTICEKHERPNHGKIIRRIIALAKIAVRKP